MFSQFVFTTPDMMNGENPTEETDSAGENALSISKKLGPDGRPIGLSGGGSIIDDKHKG